MPSCTLCSPSSRPLWKRNGKHWKGFGMGAVWLQLPTLVLPQVQEGWKAEPMGRGTQGHRLIPSFPSSLLQAIRTVRPHYLGAAGSLPQLFSTLSQVQHWAKGWGHEESCPQKPMSIQKWASGFPTQTAHLLPSKPSLPCPPLLPPSSNLSSLPQQPFLTLLSPPISCALQRPLSLPGLLPLSPELLSKHQDLAATSQAQHRFCQALLPPAAWAQLGSPLLYRRVSNSHLPPRKLQLSQTYLTSHGESRGHSWHKIYLHLKPHLQRINWGMFREESIIGIVLLLYEENTFFSFSVSLKWFHGWGFKSLSKCPVWNISALILRLVNLQSALK